MEMVPGYILNKAFEAWLKASLDTETTYGQIVRSFRALTNTCDFLMDYYSVTPETAQHIRHMAGPHGYAYCKMIKARGNA